MKDEEEINIIVSEIKEILNKYPNRQLEILFYIFGRDNLMKIINEPTYEQLQNNWNELKDWAKTEYYDGYIYSSTIIKKMQELESRK